MEKKPGELEIARRLIQETREFLSVSMATIGDQLKEGDPRAQELITLYSGIKVYQEMYGGKKSPISGGTDKGHEQNT